MKLNKKEISLIKEYIKKITSPKLENIGILTRIKKKRF